MTLEPPQNRAQAPKPLSKGEIDGMFRAAIQAHSEGRLEEAEKAYRRILQIDPKQPHALHLLGVIAYQSGRAESAVQLISQAIAGLGNVSDFHNNIGEAYRSLGRHDDAITHYRRALALEPVNPGAACNMGTALIGQGKIHEAIAAYKKALGFKPDFAEAKAKLGAALVRLPKDDPARDLERGISLLRDGLRVNPGFTEGTVSLANALADKGETEEAIGLYKQAIERSPDDVGPHFNLAIVLFEAGEVEEGRLALNRALALAPRDPDLHVSAGESASGVELESAAILCFERAAQLAPDRADVHERLAKALDRNNWETKAIESYRRVLEIEPGRPDIRIALCNCLSLNQGTDEALEILEELEREYPDDIGLINLTGRTLQRQGRFEEARHCFIRARDLDPNHAGAYYNLCIDRDYEMSDDDIKQLRALAADESRESDTRSTAQFTLGSVCHGKGDYDAAFAHYAKGNALINDTITLGAEVRRNTLDAMMSVFDSAFFEQRWAHGDDSERPVFVVGMPRSGTTLIERILAGHPEVAGAGELLALPWIAEFMNVDIKAPHRYPRCVPEMDAAATRGFARRYLDALDQTDAEARRVVDKLPGNYQHIGLIALLFPNAKIIHARRNPLDTCLSCYFQLFRKGLSYTFDLKAMAETYNVYTRYMEHWHAVRPVEILDVQYEALVADPERIARRMIDFIGLDWDPRCLEPGASNQSISTASMWQARQPVYDTSVAGWKRYEKHLGPLIEALKD